MANCGVKPNRLISSLSAQGCARDTLGLANATIAVKYPSAHEFIATEVTRLGGDHLQPANTAVGNWIVERGKRSLLAVRIPAEHKLRELKPDMERLLEDVRAGRAFSPYYEEFIALALKRIEAT